MDRDPSLVGAAHSSDDVATLVRARAVSAVFQPLVDLRSGEVVGFEALARGPVGHPLESPLALFDAARREGLTAELDWVCRAAAFRAFLEADPPPALTLLVNVEPESFGSDCPDDLLLVVGRAEATLRVMVEVNDRALQADAAALLASEERARAMGWGIALDDVGSGRRAIAMIPMVHPDVVKLDLRLLRTATDADAAAVVLAVMRHLERTGASLCVESIENDDDLRWAVALGAAFGQGRHLGPPGPLPSDLRAPRRLLPLVAPAGDGTVVETPWDLVEAVEPRLLDGEHFVELARTVARAAIEPGSAPLILAGLGRGGFDDAVAATFPAQLDPLLSVAFGVDVGEEPAPGLRGVRFGAQDPLADIQFLVVIGAKGSVALMGRAEADGKVLAVLTQDRVTVEGIARHLLRRVPRSGGVGVALPPPAAAVDEEPTTSSDPPARGRRLFSRH